jgi:uncharacterized protein YprB with RNaseH-like and TPR domain
VGLDSEGADRIVLDIETVASPDAASFLDPVRPPANYRDEAKIAAYVKEKFAERVENAGLEADLCEIVAVGWMDEDYNTANVYTRHGSSEVMLLQELWEQIGSRAIVGFNCLGFDLPVAIRRSQLLGVSCPSLNLDRYRTPHVDLLERLSFNGKLTYRSLGFYLRRFGIPHEDTTTGADIARLVAANDWAAVVSHCRSDVQGTAALARRLGWLRQPHSAVV